MLQSRLLMRVWVVDPANLTPFYDRALCGALSEGGCEVRLVTSHFRLDPQLASPLTFELDDHYFRRLPRLTQSNTATLRRASRLLSYWFDHRQFVRKARLLLPDVVHIQWSRVPRLDRWLIGQLQSAGISVVHTVHDIEPLFANAGRASILEEIYGMCDALIVHADSNVNELLERFRTLRRERIHTIPHGPLQAETIPAGATQRQARDELGIPADAQVVLFFGLIKQYKGLDVLVESFQSVAKAFPKAHLLIAGRPHSPADLPDLSALQTAGAQLTTSYSFITNDQVWKYFLACDVVALPYRNITQSGVLLSAFAFGRPAIVSRVGGLPQLIEESQAGWVVPSGDPRSLSDAIAEAFGDPARTRERGRAAKAYVERDCAWTTISARTTELYRQLRASHSQ